jgi:hypothetical protein
MVVALAPEATSVAPAGAETSATPRPGLRAIVRHLAMNLLAATVVPAVLFYVCLVTVGLWAGLIVALMWCYATVAWRLRTGKPKSVLLWLTVAGLTGKTIVAFATGSTLIYFLQPALGDAIVAAAFLVSLGTSRSAVARLAGDFYPMTHDVAMRPRVQTLFTRLTLLWAGICAAKAVVTLWLLHSLSVTNFVTAKTVFGPSAAVLGAAVTVVFAVRVARREGLVSLSGYGPPAGVSA